MKSLNLSGAQAALVLKSLRERLRDYEEEIDILEGRIHEISNKKNQISSLLSELASTGTPAEAPKKRGRKPGVKKAEVAEPTAPKKRRRKPGVKNTAKQAAAEPAAPRKRGRKPGSKNKTTQAKALKEAAPKAPKKRGRKPRVKKAEVKAAVKKAPGKRGRKPGVKATVKVQAAAPAETVAVKTETAKPATKNAKAPGKASKKVAVKQKSKSAGKPKSGNAVTLASKIITVLQEANKGMSTGEITAAVIKRFNENGDKRKITQAISSTLISLTKRGKIKREKVNNEIINIIA
jgi:hypothetical protein